MALSCVDNQDPIEVKHEPASRVRLGSGGSSRARPSSREAEEVASSAGEKEEEEEAGPGSYAAAKQPWQTFDRELAVWVGVLNKMKIDETAQQDR